MRGWLRRDLATEVVVVVPVESSDQNKFLSENWKRSTKSRYWKRTGSNEGQTLTAFHYGGQARLAERDNLSTWDEVLSGLKPEAVALIATRSSVQAARTVC